MNIALARNCVIKQNNNDDDDDDDDDDNGFSCLWVFLQQQRKVFKVSPDA